MEIFWWFLISLVQFLSAGCGDQYLYLNIFDILHVLFFSGCTFFNILYSELTSL